MLSLEAFGFSFFLAVFGIWVGTPRKESQQQSMVPGAFGCGGQREIANNELKVDFSMESKV